jgi:hypothetical protein
MYKAKAADVTSSQHHPIQSEIPRYFPPDSFAFQAVFSFTLVTGWRDRPEHSGRAESELGAVNGDKERESSSNAFDGERKNQLLLTRRN